MSQSPPLKEGDKVLGYRVERFIEEQLNGKDKNQVYEVKDRKTDQKWILMLSHEAKSSLSHEAYVYKDLCAKG